MKKSSILLIFLLAFASVYSQTVTLSFTGRGRGGIVTEEIYQQIDSMQVSNITRHWHQMIYYPDTVVMMEPLAVPMVSIKQSGLEQNVPNPFDCVTEARLNLHEADNVFVQVLDAVGKECLSYNGRLSAGEHIFEITLAKPQTYMLTTVTSTGKYSVKMVNLGTCGINSIALKSSSDVEVHSKGLISNEFYLGDEMEYLAYTTYNNIVFDASELRSHQDGSEDITIHFNIPYCSYSTNVDHRFGCMSYTWINGVTYTETNHNAAFMNLTSAGGCDSLVLLDVTIDDHFQTEESITACQPINWNGQYCSTTGTYVADLTSIGGCDSTVTLHFTRQNNILHDVYGSDCESITWNGEEYTETGDYEQTFRTQYGCDSIVTLHFTKLSDDVTVNMIACDEFTWINGRTYYGSNNTDTVHLVNRYGCDSIVGLNLTLNRSHENIIFRTACGLYNYHGVTYTESGRFEQTLSTVNGCDSIVTLVLTILHDTVIEMYERACESFTFDGNTYTQSNTYDLHYHPNAYCDSVVRLHLEIAHHTYSTQNVAACDSYTWFGEEYTSSGTYHHTLMNSQGCDSIITLNLTIKHSVENDKTINACRSYDLNGERITESCTRVITYTAANGCDSTVTYHINIFGDIETEFTQYACESFEWEGEVYTSTGNYTRHLTPVLYCDSVVTMHLFIGSQDATEIVQTACGSYTWDGRTYTESGNYPYTYRNIYGCDSVVTLRLTLNPVYSNIHDVQTACDSYEWEGDIYTQGGSFTKTLHTVAGCDSVVTLDLTIKYSVEHEFSDTAWGPYDISDGSAYATFRSQYLNNRPDTLGPYMWNDSVYTKSGDYQQTFVAANGCDSVVTLHLVYHEIVYDTRDGNVYYTLEYGDQVWTTENMRYLPQVVGISTSSNSASYYYVYGYDGEITAAAKITTNYSRYGAMYNLPAALSSCPAGWHLPSRVEWETLVAYLGSNDDYTCNSVSANVGKAMASVSYWNADNTTCAVGNDLEQNNASGFNGMPGGYKNSTGFTAISDEAVFWSSTISGSSSQRLQLAKGQATVSISLKNKAWAFYVRCVKDNE